MEQPEIVQDSEVVAEPAAEESHIEAETPETETDTEHAAPEGTTAEEEEVEFEGEKYKLPKNLKDALLRQADYTRKTQEVAEQRKTVEQQAAEVKQQAEFHQKFVAEIAEVVAIDKQLSQFAQVDWQRLYDENPVEAMKLDRQMRDLQSTRMQAAQTLTQKQQQQALARQQETAKSLQEGRAVLERDIKGWSPDTAKQVTAYMQSLGAKTDTLGNVTDPAFIKAFYKAQQYDQLLAKQTTKPKPEAQEKPVTRISAAKSGTVKDPDKMSIDEWTKWRNAQVKRR